MERVIGVIGGSGVYQMEGLEEARWQAVETPWGAPSDEILTGRVAGMRMAFLPRHGRGHVHSPSSVPYRANIDAMKRLGVSDLVAVSACGSFREDMAPGDFVIVDQFIDRTYQREKSFFGAGCVAHVAFANPTCPTLSAACLTAALDAGITVHDGGTYVAMEGPQFSTRAESEMHRAWGADLIGMTAMPEAKLAREAELCYASVAMVTDYDAWHDGHEAVDVASVIATLTGNVGKAQALIAALAPLLGPEHGACQGGCDHALDHALMTAPAKRDTDLVAKLDAVAGRVL
ncbi:5'-methylthioadenosine phosphorylase [Defluviimonas sp. 20V17]|uniref:S-methyl-5'-thioadenosine phosphorylase n=1 Tax=Allgaiera indica TaxID=765699 RepID=A0AAN4USA7_9RHOB|nr:S-methyl-5'-thioadenosine phosphorylase [Allgaiera indica]KDB02294.1 5'-methylthioadenosine phosphorylase [Defluviimonas sp. 20V17]GHE02798.1 S-methyl-5'-thioadenosine phosphorylase [Allgaiera indica]SDX17577.1 5'-methylthioadenosine phosphorylase [Allgaiera indica]